ncbi:MAG: hypothetical protein Q7R70_07115 [Candidatus Diapherotrites archaeon]|nr:hypothetical protein [Candidatus Diapherotrites archaeon]
MQVFQENTARDLKRILFLFAIVSMFFLLMVKLNYRPDLTQYVGDYGNHYRNTMHLPSLDASSMGEYAPAFSFFARFFTYSQQSFFFAVLILLALITPLLLYLIQRKFSVVWMYFASISYFWLLSSSGFLAQAVLGIWALLYLLCRKHWFLKVALVLSSVFVHGYGIFLMLLIFAVDLAFSSKLLGKFAPACSAFLPDGLKTKISVRVVESTGDAMFYSDLLNFAAKGFFLPFLILSIIQLWKENKPVLVMGVLSIASAFFINMGYRILAFSELFFLLGLSSYYESASKPVKALIVLLSIGILALNLWSWHIAFLNLSGGC